MTEEYIEFLEQINNVKLKRPNKEDLMKYINNKTSSTDLTEAIVDKGIELFGLDNFMIWFFSSSIYFDVSPSILIIFNEGMKDILAELERMEHGIF